MKNNERNIKLIAVNNGYEPGFNIFIDFSGQRELLMTHRHNGLVFNLLKNGVSLDDLKRLDTHKYYKASHYSHSQHGKRALKLETNLKYILHTVSDYMEARKYNQMVDAATTYHRDNHSMPNPTDCLAAA